MSPAPASAPPRRPFTATVAELRAVGKPSHHAPLYSRLVNRPAGRYLAAAAYRAGLTPDQVTLISAAFTFAGIAVIASVHPTPLLGVVVALLLATGYALDSADGQLARLRGGGSATGEWLDHMVDCAKGAAVHLAVLVSYYRFGGAEPGELALAAAFGLVATVMFFGTVLTDLLRRTAGPPAVAPAPARRSPVRSLVTAPADYGVLCLVFALLGWPTGFTAGYAVLFAGSTAYLAAGLVRWRRQLGALDAGR